MRVVTRLAKQVQAAAGDVGTVIRDRTRSIKKRILHITKVLKRRTGEAGQEVRRITTEMADIAEKTLQAGREAAQHLRQHVQNLTNTVQVKQQRFTTQLEKVLDIGELI